MSQGNSPSVFLSSTCFDLNQIRIDLEDFIKSYSFNPVLSEFKSFPVNPNINTISNCLENVKNLADIFILVIGGRYGSQSDEGKSITNLEYLEAKAKGIPIYIFVDKSILNILPVWRKNPNADFSNVVDSVKLFEFIESLKETKENWMFKFEEAQDIINTLKIQWSYLFMETLDLRKRFIINHIQKFINKLSPKALHILIHKSIAWEYVFFAQILKDEFENLDSLRNDLKYKVTFHSEKSIENFLELTEWFQNKIKEIEKIVFSISNLMNVGFVEAVGEPGVSGDPDKIYYIGKRFIEGYKRILEWKLNFKKISFDDDFEKAVDLTSRMSSNIINEIESFIEKAYQEITESVKKYKKDNNKIILELTLTPTLPNMNDLYDELNRLFAKFSNEY